MCSGSAAVVAAIAAIGATAVSAAHIVHIDVIKKWAKEGAKRLKILCTLKTLVVKEVNTSLFLER